MKHWIMIFCVLWCLSPASAAAADYILGPGDGISITVFGLPDLSVPEITVRSDGKITISPVGQITVAGLTIEEVSAQLTEKLSFYYENPLVTINITQFRTVRVYVVGQVNRPGTYELDKNHKLMDAIGAAQGWTKDAAKTKVYLIHDGQKSDPLKVNLMDVLKKGDTSKNCILTEGDIVYLSENNKVDIVNDVLPFVYPMYLIHHWGGGGATTTP